MKLSWGSSARQKGEQETRRDLLLAGDSETVNTRCSWGWSALHYACDSGQSLVVASLLAHPDIIVNRRARPEMATPFFLACKRGMTVCVWLLLKDPRVLVTEPDKSGNTPLKEAVECGRVDVLKWWIASGRRLNLGDRGDPKTDVIAAAESRKYPSQFRDEMIGILKRYVADPEATCNEFREYLGLHDELAADSFALVVFLCDGLLELSPATFKVGNLGLVRFLQIVRQLPMELQMILCCQAVGSPARNISSWHSEEAFISLARSLQR